VVRLLILCVAIVSMLAVAASSSAARSGQATGSIAMVGTIGCDVSAMTSDGTRIAAFGTGTFPTIKMLGGTSPSFEGPRVGFMCEGSVLGQGLPISGTLVLTGLTCKVVPDVPSPFKGDLATPGTAIFYANGDVRLICPPSTYS
jgi:hypothetical protein